MRFILVENVILDEGIQQDFKNRHGEDLFNQFMSVRNKLESPYNDMSYWIKRSSEELQDFLDNTEIKKSNREITKKDKTGAKLVAQDGNVKLYFITTYDAMKYYGKGTRWCIAGNYRGHEDRGQEYFYGYIEDYKLDGGYYVITDGKDKYCILTSDKEIESVWNPADHPVKLNVLPNAFVDVLRKYSEIHVPNEFEIENGVLLEYNGSDIDVEIPNGVTVIGNNAFYECEEVESIKIPESVSYIEAGAFYGCSNLFSIVIPKSVVTIGTEAFGHCSSLTNVTILDGVEKIQNGAFYLCSNLNSIIIPASVERIGQDAFKFCRSIETVYYGGTLEKLEKITGRGNYRLLDADNLITEIGDVKLYFNSIIESYNKSGVKMKFRLVESATSFLGKNNKVPSEEDIKEGNAYYAGLKVVYDPRAKEDASNWTTFIKVTDKFFEHPYKTQQHILNHEVAHNFADDLMRKNTGRWNEFASAFIKEKKVPEGSMAWERGQRTYWEGLYGDIGAIALSETVTQAIVEYLDNPDRLKQRSKEAFNEIDNYMRGIM